MSINLHIIIIRTRRGHTTQQHHRHSLVVHPFVRSLARSSVSHIIFSGIKLTTRRDEDGMWIYKKRRSSSNRRRRPAQEERNPQNYIEWRGDEQFYSSHRSLLVGLVGGTGPNRTAELRRRVKTPPADCYTCSSSMLLCSVKTLATGIFRTMMG